MSFFSTPTTIEKRTPYNEQQQQAFMQILQQALGQLANPQQGFEPQAQLARQQFQEEGIPSLAERFSGLGAGSQRSSAFTGELAKGLGGLESQLAALGSQYGQRQQGLAQNLLGLGLTPQDQFFVKPGEEGWGSKLGGILAQGAGTALGSFFSGGGTIQDILSGISGLFKRRQGGGQHGGQQNQAPQQQIPVTFQQNPQGSFANLNLLSGRGF